MRSPLETLTKTLAGPAIVVAITIALDRTGAVNLTTAGFALLVAVLLIAAQWGRMEAIFTAIAAAVCLNYVFVPPVGTFRVDKFEDWVALGAFIVTALVASHLSESARRRAAQLEQRQIEMDRLHELNRTAEAARQSEQFKATLLQALAHEFKTPLTSIRAATSAILTSGAMDNAQREELLTIIGQESERLSRLMKEAFHLARVESGKLHLSRAPQDVERLVQGTISETPSVRGRSIDVRCQQPMPLVEVDVELLSVALKQLLDNAGKYSPADAPIRVTAETSPDSVWIRVRDRGPGLSEQERMKVFERFYRSDETSARVPGTGIGLAIALDILKAHGGSIDVESAPGMGTEFSMRIPLAKEELP